MKKIIVTMLMVFSFMFVAAPVLVATNDVVHAEGIKSKISGNTEDLEKTVDEAGGTIIDTIREIAIVIIVVLVASMGFSYFFKKSAESLQDMKLRLGVLVLAIICVFFTEQIVGTLFGLMGYEIK